ncbi:SPATA7 [Cervus elaphus hippelaphus]|uniref:SPATA7 n=1 Tax=Cervus elaphus hippelaphus TaxID=46360 RepID=A0A212CV52_CEREH|nr:SPATA7 [Cervus elaphus hippelaphus]
MDASRRVRATSVLPTFGPSCLFKGHLSTKSNAFCTDSSSLRLSTLQLVKNHMAVHYNKILSAKGKHVQMLLSVPSLNPSQLHL